MGLLDKIFKSDGDETKEKSEIPWTDLTDKDQITIAKEESKDKLIGIFKHSTRCGISRMVLRNFEKQYQENENIKLYFLDLVKHRDVSNAVADELSVRHESPQFIVLRDEKVVHHASHQDIDATKLEDLA
ncbi:bacillithiol system redox-active protein YtxJ [Salegentibacter salegens]|uniref:Bacillithiol system protein YtxJ n=1 Tax=Salegentibacter salegens TaxID=143223 RepID=A0A1M7NX79_9FLAO|nr:bacillithiol system redox-active protein YtxJ [Salegentibacter salegens]PRX46422.1 bacillithiol system protein YtxJ [Salegentibacter salegens]SHN08716.1 bacillithiol system protein YtxJ [Salegentibacter salegens]